MMRLFKDAALSFYSGSFYGELARQRRGIGLRHVFLLTFILLFMGTLALYLSGGFAKVHDGLERLPALVKSLPAITVKDGKLSIDKPVPYKLDLGSPPQSYWLVIDTGYKVEGLEELEQYMRKDHIVILMTADKIISRRLARKAGQNEFTSTIEMSDIRENQTILSFTHNNLQTLAQAVEDWGVPVFIWVALGAGFLAMFITNLLSTFMTAVVVMILGLTAQVGFEFAAAMRLSAAARIPIMILSLIPALFWDSIPGGITGWVIWGIYMLFAVAAVRLYQPQKAS